MAAAVGKLQADLRESIADLLRLFASVYFAVSLFAVWGLFTLVGVIVEQGKEPDFYFNVYSPPLARLVLRLHLDNIYHSIPYVGIIGLILCSLAVCTFKRVIPARLPPLRAVKIERIPLHATIAVDGNETDVRSRIEDFFRERGWTIRKRSFEGEEWTFADKHNWARRGVLVAHIGFVIITAGTSWYWAQGFSGDTAVLTGTTVTIPQTGAKIALDNFNYRIDPIKTKAGVVYQPIDYVSHVRYVGRDGIIRSATIRVNDPLNIDGTLYYQAAYGFGVKFAVTKNGVPVAGTPAYPIKEGDSFQIGTTDKTVQYNDFVGTIDRKTGRPSPDPRPHDPGVVVRLFSADQLAGQALIPIGTKVDLGDGYALSPVLYSLYSGIQYRYDPGMVLVGVGALVLLAGLCIAFYLLPARLYVKLTGGENHWQVGIAATTVKGYDVFEEEFANIVRSLDSRTKAPACS